MSIPFERYDAILFDLDGTLVNTMDLHNQAWIETIKNYGHSITEKILEEYAGVPNEKTIEIFNQRFDWSLNPSVVAEAKESLFLKSIHNVRPIQVVLKIAKENYKKKPMAIVSGGSRNLVGKILHAIKAETIFSVRVCAEDTARGKPSPDPFLRAAQLLQLSPAKCLVFEDGDAGITGAFACGMGVVKVERDFKLKFLG